MKNSPRFYLNLQVKVALVAVTSLVVVASALTVYYRYATNQSATEAIHARLLTIALNLANESAAGLSTASEPQLKSALACAMRQPDVISARIYDHTGSLLATTGNAPLLPPQWRGPGLATQIDEPVQLPLAPELLLGGVATPIYAEDGANETPGLHRGRKLGVVEVIYSLAGAKNVAAQTNHTALLLTALLVLLWALLISVSARTLIRPLRELLHGTEELAAGNYSARVEVSSRDELGELARAFNQMGDRLQAAYREVLDYQRNLEQRITERTVDFSTANARLMGEIVERKNSELRLREAETKYRTLVEQLPAITYISELGPAGKWNYISPQITPLLGFSIDQWQAAPTLWLNQMHPDDRAKAIAARETSRQTGNPFAVEYRMHSRDGRLVWFADRGAVLCDLTGKSCYVHGVMFDITDRKRLEHQFLQSQKVEAVGRLAGGIAHDFNNILTAILGYAELIHRRVQPGDPIHTNSDQIQKAAQRAADLTRQLLAYSRKQVLEPRVIKLNDVISDLEKMLCRLIGEDIQFVSILGPHLACVRADPTQIEQVIMNLVVNARDAMPAGGTLTIQTANVPVEPETAALHGVTPGNYVTLRVTDTGTGMDEETKAHLFEPFYTTKPIGTGTGLGLATCSGIIQQSAGHITVESAPDRGSSFTIYLPADATPTALVVPEPAQPVTPVGKEHILVVEDEPAIRELAALELRELGYTVQTAGDGEEALTTIQESLHPPDLLITDVVMPKMGGPELAETLRRRQHDTRVLFISGYTADTIGRHGVLDEGISFLRKPFTAQGLARKVREVLDETA